MAKALTGAMPANCPLGVDCTVEVVAQDPTDGSTITGVTVAQYSIYVESVEGARDLSFGPFMYVPGPSA